MPFPLDLEFIRQAEKKLGVRFPAGFVDRMTRLNGGRVQVDQNVFELHPIFDSSDRKRATRTSSHVNRETTYMREHWPDFPQEAVVIGQDGSGDRLILLPEPSDPLVLSSQVFIWDHETGVVTDIASDFSDLQFIPERQRGDGNEPRS